MGGTNSTATAPKFRRRAAPADNKQDATPTVHLSYDPLKSIYIYLDVHQETAEEEMGKKKGGTIVFVAQSGKKVSAYLTLSWFPPGTWELNFSKKGFLEDFKCLHPTDMPATVLDRIKSHLNEKEYILSYIVFPEFEAAVNNMFSSAAGHKVRLVVSYANAEDGNIKSVDEVAALTDEHKSVLSDPDVARLYLAFVEHFGNVAVDFLLAEGGLTEAEIAQVEKGKPEVKEVTQLFTRGFSEFQAAKGSASPAPALGEFREMEEAIFFQRQVKNDLARRNLLSIGMGGLFVTGADGKLSLQKDIGVLRTRKQQADLVLLYDRHGNAVRSFMGGYLDIEYRSVDMAKIERDTGIPFFEIEVEDKGLYFFLRTLEQKLALPLREVEALVVSLFKHTVFIRNEIHRRYNGEIGERIIQMGKVVIGFFVAHAFAAYLSKTKPEVGIPLMLLIKGAGIVLGFSALLMDSALLMEAGRHFTQMEQLHRQTGDKEPVLTKLSEFQLRAGAKPLIDALADIAVMGGFMLVGGALTKFGPTILEGLKKKVQPKFELKIEKNEAAEIKALDDLKEVKMPATKIGDGTEVKVGAEKPEPAKDQPESHEINGKDAYQGEPQRGKVPKQEPFVYERPKALDQSPAEFEKDEVAQKELFAKAQEAVARMNAFIKRVIEDSGIKNVDAESIMKRDDFGGFVKSILAKVGGRKKYATIGEMSDIIRGRVNLENPSDVRLFVRAMKNQGYISDVEVTPPGERCGIENGYPRYHVDVIDPQTGLKHEWQIGTKETTRIYQKPGIDTGDLIIENENRNIHDIEYDIFQAIEEPSADKLPAEKAELISLSKELKIGEFRKRVAQLSARTGSEKIPVSELDAEIDSLHKTASAILKALIQKKGVAFVQHFLHK